MIRRPVIQGLVEASDSIMVGKLKNVLILPSINTLEVHRVPSNELAPSNVALMFTWSMDDSDYDHQTRRSEAMKVAGYRNLVETLVKLLVKQSDEEV